MLHHIVPKKIGKQDQQISAGRQAILFALVGAVAAGEVAVNFNAVAAEHGGDIAQGVGLTSMAWVAFMASYSCK